MTGARAPRASPIGCPTSAPPTSTGAGTGGCTSRPVTDGMWRSLMDCIGRPELAADPAHATDEGALRGAGGRSTRTSRRGWRSARWRTWRRRWRRRGSPCGVYRTTAEVHEDPHVEARAMLEWVDMEAPGMERVPVSGGAREAVGDAGRGAPACAASRRAQRRVLPRPPRLLRGARRGAAGRGGSSDSRSCGAAGFL